MADNLKYINQKPQLDLTGGLGTRVAEMKALAKSRRKKFDQRWYDNMYFDDGYHFRYVSRTTGKVVDLSQKDVGNFPIRAIPKARRQIRGIINLLVQPDYKPVIYPKKVVRSMFKDEASGQVNEALYQQAYETAKAIAQKTGAWLEDELNDHNLKKMLVQLLIMASKTSVAYMQIYPDPIKEKIKVSLYDGFDLELLGHFDDIQKCPFIIKPEATSLDEILANENYDQTAKDSILADNKYSSSDVKDAYMTGKYGQGQDTDKTNTAIVNEVFIKEYLTKETLGSIGSKFPDAIEGKEAGDVVMLHAFTFNSTVLMMEYLPDTEYPFIALTLEPGPLWQTPIIENFIPANKSYDIAMSRVERWFNTISGVWAKRKGENFEITNNASGQVIEYEAQPPVSLPAAGLPNGANMFLQSLEKIIEEQGASTSALSQLPPGVKSGTAIESLKASEYANLEIPATQIKDFVKGVAKRFISLAGNYFVNPKTVALLDNGEPNYFDIIGKRGVELRQELGLQIPEETIVIDPDTIVDIEVDVGLAFTMEGKRQVIQQVATFMLDLAKQQLLNPESVKVVVQKFLETFKFGATQEFMDALDTENTTAKLSEDQLQMIKIAVAEVLKDAGVAGNEAEKRMVDTTKMGVAETLKDLGGINATNQ